MGITANQDLRSNGSEKARFTRDPFHGIFFAESCPFSKKIRSHASRKGRHPYQSVCRKHGPCYCLFLEEIGLKNGAALHEIFRQEKKIGCRPCPENTGLFLRLAWKSHPQSRSFCSQRHASFSGTVCRGPFRGNGKRRCVSERALSSERRRNPLVARICV